MFAVIFKAEINYIDKEYFEVAKKMRSVANLKYGCIKFMSITEGNNEIAISYWNTLKEIEAWKKDKEHLKAQENGKNKWYKSYNVQVVEILREYGSI